ncbi:MAG: CPBP family intramembrane glutamic endopeptidase [Candidatus Micrarchaeia archaeon]
MFFLSSLTVGFADVSALTGLFGQGAVLILLANEILFRDFLQQRVGVWKAAALFALLYPSLLAGNFGEWAAFAMFAAAYGLLQGIVAGLEGVGASAGGALLYYALSFGAGWAYFASVPLSLLLLAVPLYVELERKAGLRQALSELGVHTKNLLPNVMLGIALALFVFLALLAIGLLFALLGANDQYKVAQKVREAHILVLFAAVFLSPFSEEIFFRGFLASRLGAGVSALAFALAHAGYGSAVEMAGALLIGYVFALAFLRTRSLTAPILAHFVLNAVAVAVFTGVAA